MSIDVNKMRKPQSIFVLYMLASAVLIIIFRFIFPGAESPLSIYSRNWRLIRGAVEFFNLFPALAFSALVIPFGLASLEESYQSFSDMFFRRLVTSVVTAICAAVVYALIFFLISPMVKNMEENLKFSGELYNTAKLRAYECRDDGEWYEASQFLGVCDRIWYNSKELAGLREEVAINLQEQSFESSGERSSARTALARRTWRKAELLPLSGGQEIDAVQAINLSEEAFEKGRYFDAHWFATIAQRLVPAGDPQANNAARIASEAWNKISSQDPNLREQRLSELYEIKVDGYRAMNTGDWIHAFYIFQELLTYTPDDPDVVNFLAASERGAKETAFFLDEMELSLGDILNSAVFSLPNENGRAVLRFSNLTISKDIAYGIGFEYMNFDMYQNPRSSVTARYVKLMPFKKLDGTPQILVLTHALDRSNENADYRGEWIFGEEPTGNILLDISFEDFTLIANVRRGLPNLQIDELFSASGKLEKFGYIYQIFQGEILNRISAALFFLPMAIIIIVIAWRYRAKAKPRYLFVLLLPVLPVVFNGLVFLYRSVFNTLGIWLILNIGFTPALVVYIVTLGLLLLVSLIVLAGQHT